MVNLAAVKQNVYRVSPALYERLYRVYAATPFQRHRSTRRGRDVAERLRERIVYEAQAVQRYLQNDWTVRHGPFSGMRYMPVTSNSLLMPKLIGSYESPIHRWIIEAIEREYQTIIDIGCAEGYYAVGFAIKSASSRIYAYDSDEAARKNASAIAASNGVADRVQIRGACTPAELKAGISGRTLIFCDIEGGEFDLLRPERIPALVSTDLIVETHDSYRPGITENLVRRFHPSHRIEIIYHHAKSATEFPALGAIPATEHALLLEEGRPGTQSWIRFLANPPGAIQPVHWWGGEA